MNTKKQLNNILNKFPKKTELQKVELNKIQDIEDYIGTAQMMQDAFEEAYDDAMTKVIRASDIIRFDWSDAITEAEGMIDEVLQDLKELGVEPTSEIKQFQKQLEDLEQERKFADKKLDNIGR
jgi:predicted DNA binding CopG/RHH family protein